MAAAMTVAFMLFAVPTAALRGSVRPSHQLLASHSCSERAQTVGAQCAQALGEQGLSRRSAFRLALQAGSAVVLGEAALRQLPAYASGGATAGKTTSIPRAKARYYGRITEAVNSFLSLKAPAEAGTKLGGSDFFKENGPYSEFMTAGYLLAVAFKIDAKIPPSRIAQVGKHGALMASLDKLKSASPANVGAAYAAAAVALDDFLDSVELPPLSDGRYE
uniref:Uncharacterized protein n=1 Tax=Chrysotila carterae TaxID=13221 RepID=A0A7S4EW22_CHRCT